MKIHDNAKGSPDMCIQQSVLTKSAAGEDSWAHRPGTVSFLVKYTVQNTSEVRSAEDVIISISQKDCVLCMRPSLNCWDFDVWVGLKAAKAASFNNSIRCDWNFTM